jgi:hypothetical protein
MADVNFILTNAGAAALVNAANTGTDPVIISHCGVSATAVVPSAASTVLTGEIKRISTLSGGIVSPDTIHVIVRDESTASYTLRSLALYTDDGTLFAIYGQTGIIMQKSAGAMLLLTIDAKFVDVDASLISFGDTNFLNPPATETVQGVIEIATQAEANGGADDSRALTPKKAKAALLTWLLAQDGAGSGIDADLLDGKHAAAFLELVNFTGAAVLTKLLTADGAGTGLDADLLDGQQGSYYTDIIARLGYTPLNALLYTAADVLAKLLTVDGAGSGIDADTLDGQHGTYYTNIPARLGFTPLNSAAFTAAAVMALMLTVDGAGSGLDADLLDGQQGSYYADIIARLGFTPLNSTAYTASDVLAKLLSVDGSGSGVDADLLDGQHASAFPSLGDFANNMAASGYQRMPNGFLMQWGRLSVQSDSYGTLTFPVAFDEACYYIGGGVATEIGNGNGQANGPMPYGTPSKTTASFWNAAPASSAWWLAIGK